MGRPGRGARRGRPRPEEGSMVNRAPGRQGGDLGPLRRVKVAFWEEGPAARCPLGGSASPSAQQDRPQGVSGAGPTEPGNGTPIRRLRCEDGV